MALLAPEFRHDLFISYSQGDADGTGTSPLKIWSQAFARELERELHVTPGLENCTVFLDESNRPEQGLASNDPLTQQLRSPATGSAFLLLLMSPHYLRSGWCKDERNWWLQTNAANAFPEIGSRIYVVRIWPTGGIPWPQELCDERGNPFLGIWFHEQPGDPFSTRPFGWVDPTGSGGDFRKAVVATAGQVAARLTKLQEALLRKREVVANIAKLGNDGGQTIYVHARARNEARWESAVEDLLQAGYGVLPSAPEPNYQDPQKANAAGGEVVRILSACDGLLLVPDDDPLSLVSDLAVVGYQWRNSARAFARKPLPCAVVDQGQIVDRQQRLQRSAKSLRIDWIHADLPDWTGQVKSWLAAAVSGQLGAP